MPPKRPIGGSGGTGAAKAPEHVVEVETEVAVVNDVELPQPEAEFHTDSADDSGDDSDDDGQLVSHLFPFMCQIDHRDFSGYSCLPLLE